MVEQSGKTPAPTTIVPITTTEVPLSAFALKFTDNTDIDQEAHRLYVGDNWAAGIDVYDISTPTAKYMKTIRMDGMTYRMWSIWGVCVAKEVKKVFAGLGESSVAVIDIDPASPKRDRVIATVDTGGRGWVDMLGFDPVHKKLYAANRNFVANRELGLHLPPSDHLKNDEGFVTSIDGATNQVIKRIDLGPFLEQPRYNPGDGMVYVTGTGDSVLYQIDPKTDKLVRTFPVGGDCSPHGMAINPKTNQALLAGHNPEHPQTVIWDLAKGQVVSVISETGNGDGALYNAKVDRFFLAASGAPGGPVMRVYGGQPVRLLTKVPTASGSSWPAFDETHSIVYAPTNQEGRPGIVSFTLPGV